MDSRGGAGPVVGLPGMPPHARQSYGAAADGGKWADQGGVVGRPDEPPSFQQSPPSPHQQAAAASLFKDSPSDPSSESDSESGEPQVRLS
uniref:Uncharacterized protein n=1 Tax=Chromera velia CCMP2878 TaxID=1169474 RepID=A0A0G4HWY1_9ALVE|eukprot:Cvel_9149.t1-p1 / transcript=Cvel_9149.t1 / gene=Cvel_9149 / organism=Chromera_velia_CCMP2878 / gene_product=hypothetical protein / transcript_product=hypothetical protein / location=Cvel_scaffold521:2161-2427(-) / protein_length=89 / sequence_SO=supercontig / SO=protein_coding / is_pseudo=false